MTVEAATEINGVPLVTEPTSGLTSGVSLNETFDNFLTLLTTQLENQDPMSPMDTAQFTEQLVLFSSVEQALSTNQKLDQLIALQGGGLLSDAVDLIGKQVSADGSAAVLQNGVSRISYDLQGSAAQVGIALLDQSGQVVRGLTGPTSAGAHEIVWDGTDQNGARLPDGEYSLMVSAVDDEGNPVPVTQGLTGTVTGIRLENNEVVLSLGTVDLKLDEVLAIRTPDEAAPDDNDGDG
jgi:flagellar basal-body rod modification protein FlgD